MLIFFIIYLMGKNNIAQSLQTHLETFYNETRIYIYIYIGFSEILFPYNFLIYTFDIYIL